MKTAKRKGTANEHRTIQLLERSGYRTTRAAGSFGVWDGVSMNKHTLFLWQCKTNRKPSRKEIVRMKDFPAPPLPWCIRGVFIWHDRQKNPEILWL